MTFRRISRVCAALTLAAGTTASLAALAGPARAAAEITCTPVHFIAFYSTPPTEPSIQGQNYQQCGMFRDYLTMTIYKLESGSWVEVASGPGHADYLCNGSASNMYKDQSGDEITAPCV